MMRDLLRGTSRNRCHKTHGEAEKPGTNSYWLFCIEILSRLWWDLERMMSSIGRSRRRVVVVSSLIAGTG